MKHYSLKILSKNKKSLKDFFIFLSNTPLKLYMIKRSFQKTKKKTIITILKSPHVYKTAQEQFEYRTFKHKLNVYSPLNFKLLIILKKIKSNLLYDLKFKIRVSIHKGLSRKTNRNILNSHNYKLEILNVINSNKKNYYSKAAIKKKLKKQKNILKELEKKIKLTADVLKELFRIVTINLALLIWLLYKLQTITDILIKKSIKQKKLNKKNNRLKKIKKNFKLLDIYSDNIKLKFR